MGCGLSTAICNAGLTVPPCLCMLWAVWPVLVDGIGTDVVGGLAARGVGRGDEGGGGLAGVVAVTMMMVNNY